MYVTRLTMYVTRLMILHQLFFLDSSTFHFNGAYPSEKLTHELPGKPGSNWSSSRWCAGKFFPHFWGKLFRPCSVSEYWKQVERSKFLIPIVKFIFNSCVNWAAKNIGIWFWNKLWISLPMKYRAGRTEK